MTMRSTPSGGPTACSRGRWRLLTDPTFDPPGRRHAFGRAARALTP